MWSMKMNKHLEGFLLLLSFVLMLNGIVYFIKILFGTYILSLLNSGIIVYQIDGSTKILSLIPKAVWGFIINFLLLINGGLLWQILGRINK